MDADYLQQMRNRIQHWLAEPDDVRSTCSRTSTQSRQSVKSSRLARVRAEFEAALSRSEECSGIIENQPVSSPCRRERVEDRPVYAVHTVSPHPSVPAKFEDLDGREFPARPVSPRTSVPGSDRRVSTRTNVPGSTRHVSSRTSVPGSTRHVSPGRLTSPSHLVKLPTCQVNSETRPPLTSDDQHGVEFRRGIADGISELGVVLSQLIAQINVSNNLPKPDLQQFDGNPIQYSKFIHNFESNVGSCRIPDKLKLNYLIQFCSGKAKQCVESFVLLEPGEGYKSALCALRERFGMPHVVARAHMEGVVNGPNIKGGDLNALVQLSADLDRCQLTLSGIGFDSDLNSSDNLRKIVRRLPHHLKYKWVDKAYHVLENTGREARFADLAKFVAQNVKASSTMYAFDLASEKPVIEKGNKPQSNFGVTSLVTRGSTDASNHCDCCKGNCASLDTCSKFKSLKVAERRMVVRQLMLCNNCLKPNHFAKHCYKEGACAACRYKHHSLLHQWAPDETPQRGNCSATCTDRKVAMAILPVRVQGARGGFIDTYALLDNGSDVTLCEESLLRRLGIRGKKKTFSITTVNQETVTRSGNEVCLHVRPMNGGESVKLRRVWTVNRLPISLSGLPDKQSLRAWPHLKDVTLPKVRDGEVSILIGSDMPEVLCPLEVRRGKPGEPCAMLSCLGWTVIGPMHEVKDQRSEVNVNFQQGKSDLLSSQVERFWETEFSDFTYSAKGPGNMSIEDKRALKKFEASTIVENGHYRMALPWRNESAKLPKNFALAYSRLNMLKNKLQRDPAMHEKYKATVSDYINKGYARPLTPKEVSKPGSRVWYLPHHPVVNVNKPGKVRVVFDCAAKFAGTSLNENLLRGPDLVNSLVGVLLRFRLERIAVAGDIEAMFHQVRVDPIDHDSLRFLWWPDGDMSKNPREYCMQVHLFGATSSPSCSAYALKRAADDQQEVYGKLAVNTVNRNFYVDDCLKSVPDEKTAIDLIKDLRLMLANRGFRLTKWLSNSRSVLCSIPESERSPHVESLEIGELPCDRALGVRWNVELDCLEFKVQIKEKPENRRGILSVTSSLFDPLGLVSPVTLQAKLILQNLCRARLGWDDEIPPQECERWRQWLVELPFLNKLQIPRCIKPSRFINAKEAEIHLFSDASEYGYGACAYLRIKNDDGDVYVSLILGKSRLAPIKQVSIPRLELSAAVVACRLKVMIESEMELGVESYVFWTDSTIVLGYIRNVCRRFKTFVANRLSVIHENTKVHQWRHVPGSLNPADLASRGISAGDTSQLQLWLNGPGFLNENPDKWPVEDLMYPALAVSDHDPEIKVNVNVIQSDGALHNLWNYFSSYSKLKRVIAWFLRFIEFCKAKYLKRSTIVKTGHLSVSELSLAETTILKCVQLSVYQRELMALSSGKEIKLDSRLKKLCPILDEGLLRVGGRLRNSALDSNSKHPVILPAKHQVTRMIILEFHNFNGHVGLQSVLCASRRRYWIVGGVGAIKRVLRDCFDCKRRTIKPCAQQMAQLPVERLTPDKPPFNFIGIDYFGPILVKVGRSHCKRYGCLFTCFTTRAVHVEIAHSLETESFLCAFRRFAGRRGNPEMVYSDNGTNLTSGEKELRLSLAKFNQEKIYREFSQKGIEWKFHPPFASHMGGVYERMIRSIRKILKSLAGEQLLSDESLLTLCVEAERIVNDRPITYVSTDPSDPQVLTPNTLLLLRSNVSLPPGVFSKADSYPIRRWRQVQYLAGIFWRRWLREYLPTLQETQKWQRPQRNLKVNDVVLVVNDNLPRGKWPLAIVKQVNVGRDGLVRSCKVCRGGTDIIRPITRLCLLEAS